jgi:replicative DNA helicase
MATEKENFGQQFGSAFQTKVIAGLLVDQSFVDKIWGIIKPEYFDSKIHNWLFKKVSSHYETYRTMPTIEDLDLYMREEKDENKRLEAFTLLKQIQKSDTNSLKLAKDRALDFCKNHNMRNALIHSVDLWEQGKYDEIKREIEKAMFAGEDDNIGHDYFEDSAINRRYSSSNRTPIPTGMKHLDVLLNGGLSRGELGVIVAGTGAGKSWLLCFSGFNALKLNKKVMHYTFELNEDYVGIRYDTMFSGIPIKNLSSNVTELKQVLKQHTGNKLIIKEYNPKTVTISDLKNHIESRLLRRSFIPDLIVVDYADLIKSHSKYTDKRFELESVYEDLRGMAKEFQVPIWTACFHGDRLG